MLNPSENPLLDKGAALNSPLTAPSACLPLRALFEQLVARDPKSPLARLYAKSLEAPDSHFEGSACIPALHGAVEELRDAGHARADFAEMERRFDQMRGLARDIFAQLKDIKAYYNDFYPERGKHDVPVLAVVFFGSFVRGKPEPGDVDVRIVIPYSQAREVDTFMMGFNEAQSAVSWEWRSSETLPRTFEVNGKQIKIAAEVDSHYAEGGGLEFVEKCPFLVFMKGEQPEHMHMFVNVGGKGYLSGRAP